HLPRRYVPDHRDRLRTVELESAGVAATATGTAATARLALPSRARLRTVQQPGCRSRPCRRDAGCHAGPGHRTDPDSDPGVVTVSARPGDEHDPAAPEGA